jgi:hypothetical protein
METTYNRSYGGPEERCGREDGHAQSSFSGVQKIRNSPTGVGQGRRSSGSGKKSQNDECPDVLRCDHTAVEDGEEDVCTNEEFTSSKDFRHGCPEKRTDDETKNETWNEVSFWNQVRG